MLRELLRAYILPSYGVDFYEIWHYGDFFSAQTHDCDTVRLTTHDKPQ